MTEPRAEALLAAAAGVPIAVLGDVMLDRYVWGDVSRISPEAPVPVVLAGRETTRLGGAANVAANLRSLGAEVRLVGAVGADDGGATLRGELEAAGVGVSGLLSLRGRSTTEKTRILARNQQVVRLDREDAAELSEADGAALVERLRGALEGARALLISDYGKGVIGSRVLAIALEEAGRRSIPVSVDPKETHFFQYKNVTTITPNVHEAGAALGRKLVTDEEVRSGGRELRERLDAESVLITRGERGMSLVERERFTHLPALAREVYDVTGAGDTVVATMCLAHAGGASLPEAAELSNIAASIVIREVGTASATPGAILRVLRESHDARR